MIKTSSAHDVLFSVVILMTVACGLVALTLVAGLVSGRLDQTGILNLVWVGIPCLGVFAFSFGMLFLRAESESPRGE